MQQGRGIFKEGKTSRLGFLAVTPGPTEGGKSREVTLGAPQKSGDPLFPLSAPPRPSRGQTGDGVGPLPRKTRAPRAAALHTRGSGGEELGD